MSLAPPERRPGLQKTTVECERCGVRESFYSVLSADGFRLRHRGHDAPVAATQKDGPQTKRLESASAVAVASQATVVSQRPAPPVPRDEPPAATPVLESQEHPSPPRRVTTRRARRHRARATPREEVLLVSASWHAHGGEPGRREAVRISKVLKAFRWKVEPAYTIRAIVDDVLGVETTGNRISRTLISKVEGAGYLLTAVSIQEGTPVAWFKRSGQRGRSTAPGAGDELDADLEAGVAS